MSSAGITIGRAVVASALVAGPAIAAAPHADAAPDAAPQPRYCLADFSTRTAAGEVATTYYEDRTIGTWPMKGSSIPAGSRFIEPVVINPDPTSLTVSTLVVARDGALQSITHKAVEPDTEDPTWRSAVPVKIGQGWGAVRDIAAPADLDSPYYFAVLGNRLNRYTLKTQSSGLLTVRNAPHAATAGFGNVRSITWTRATTVGRVSADVLVGLDGGSLVEYIVPRQANPRVTRRVLAQGWGGVSEISAGVCLTDDSDEARVKPMTPLLARVRQDVRLYVDRDNRNGTGTDIANFGRIGAWPAS